MLNGGLVYPAARKFARAHFVITVNEQVHTADCGGRHGAATEAILGLKRADELNETNDRSVSMQTMRRMKWSGKKWTKQADSHYTVG